MTTEHLVQFQDETLERLRALLIFQGQLASPSFRGLVDAVDNPELAHALGVMAWDARGQKRDLEDALDALINEGRDATAAGPRTSGPPASHREIVESWLEITETAAAIYRDAARDAQDPVARMKLEKLAAQEDHHASMFRDLL